MLLKSCSVYGIDQRMVKRTRTIILAIGVVLIIADCLYPPYVLVLEVNGHQYGEKLSRGHRFLLTQGFNQSDADAERRLGLKNHPFDRPGFPSSEFFFTRINYRRLGLQVLIITLITIVSTVVATLLSKRRD